MRTIPVNATAKELFLKRLPFADPYGCWIWMGKLNASGYGVIVSYRQSFLAHRVAYEALIGPIPEGLVVDHLCEVTYCVNPTHFRIVEQRENSARGRSPSAQHARKTHCLRGHPLSGENIRVDQRLGRVCLTCLRLRWRRTDARRKAKRDDTRENTR